MYGDLSFVCDSVLRLQRLRIRKYDKYARLLPKLTSERFVVTSINYNEILSEEQGLHARPAPRSASSEENQLASGGRKRERLIDETRVA